MERTEANEVCDDLIGSICILRGRERDRTGEDCLCLLSGDARLGLLSMEVGGSIMVGSFGILSIKTTSNSVVRLSQVKNNTELAADKAFGVDDY